MRYPAGVVLPPGVYERVQKNHRIKPTFHFILSSRKPDQKHGRRLACADHKHDANVTGPGNPT